MITGRAAVGVVRVRGAGLGTGIAVAAAPARGQRFLRTYGRHIIFLVFFSSRLARVEYGVRV